MHILLVADGRSAITRNWIKVLQPLGYRISLVSTYPCEAVEGVELAAVLPVAFARFGGSQAGTVTTGPKKTNLTARFRPLLAQVRHWLGPWTVVFYRRRLKAILRELRPDLVHALRIPYEGMLAAATPRSIPLVISSWGNDFTLHAPASPRMRRLTRQTMARADALMSDTPRDVRLAKEWGLSGEKPTLVIVGNGGLDLGRIRQISDQTKRSEPVRIINPRGLRSYVRNDTFFKSIPQILAKHPQAIFVCPSMAGQVEAQEWVEKLGIFKNVNLLPMLAQEELWKEFARATVAVSISEHDGTPNSLLEAMAFGCLPVCGDIETIRDWIQPGINGELVNPGNADSLAQAVIALLDEPRRYQGYQTVNRKLIDEKADSSKLLPLLDDFYRRLLSQANPYPESEETND
jgi:glycosyltransferase involved in cell wall biosynthesis